MQKYEQKRLTATATRDRLFVRFAPSRCGAVFYARHQFVLDHAAHRRLAGRLQKKDVIEQENSARGLDGLFARAYYNM